VAAWKDAKNEDIAADIISFIRTMAIGSSLVSHEERIQKAVNDIRQMKDWNKVQLKWIDRIEKQLLQETVLRVEDLNDSPFDDAGGFDRLNKIFEHQLTDVMNRLNNNLYTDIA
jgi:type I restriction enzyme, R subunit